MNFRHMRHPASGHDTSPLRDEYGWRGDAAGPQTPVLDPLMRIALRHSSGFSARVPVRFLISTERGNYRASEPPFVVITSHRTRELHERCGAAVYIDRYRIPVEARRMIVERVRARNAHRVVAAVVARS